VRIQVRSPFVSFLEQSFLEQLLTAHDSKNVQLPGFPFVTIKYPAGRFNQVPVTGCWEEFRHPRAKFGMFRQQLNAGEDFLHQAGCRVRIVQGYEFCQSLNVTEGRLGPNHLSHRDNRIFASLWETKRPSSAARSPRPMVSRMSRRRHKPSKVSTSTRYAAARPRWVIKTGSLLFSTAEMRAVALRFSVVTNSTFTCDTLVTLAFAGKMSL